MPMQGILLSVAGIAVGVLALVAYTLFTRPQAQGYQQHQPHQGYSPPPSPPSPPSPPPSSGTYNNSNSANVRQRKKDEKKNDCVICLESLNTDIKETLCAHRFHGECLIIWKKHSPVCPVCRAFL